jgi:hypothetical protein
MTQSHRLDFVGREERQRHPVGDRRRLFLGMQDDFGGEERLVDLLQYNLRQCNFVRGWRTAMLLFVDDDRPL